ncbi:hypothetical protein FACS189490_03250 [Clostridia bacterium]|nr:hypothetical protein FACS189490_03250 [Clostridia bacterium]
MSENKIQYLSVEQLDEFKGHPFKPYEGKRLDDMVESVKANGVITPIIVRPKDGRFEILSGHNRVAAAKLAELTEVPAVVREDINDELAMLIVTETNLRQRTFEDMSHSERAFVLANHHNALKHQGKRSDLVNEIDELLQTSGQSVQKLTTRERSADEFGLNGKTVARYLRVNQLIPELKERVDDGKIAFLTGVVLSYLRESEQQTVDRLLSTYHITTKLADKIRALSEDHEVSEDEIVDIIGGTISGVKKTRTHYKISRDAIREYLPRDIDEESIDNWILEAISSYAAKATDK